MPYHALELPSFLNSFLKMMRIKIKHFPENKFNLGKQSLNVK